ncbi:MAG TPA: hypothetical protein VGH99_20740 [Pseudonocardia sp.]
MPEEVPPVDRADDWREVDPRLRALAVAVVGAALLSWWPAFTLGAYGTVFFEQLLALWAAATAAFLVLVIFKRHRAVSWPRRFALLLPSGWLLVAFALPTGTGAGHSRVLFWLALALTVAGGPYLAWVLLRITLVGYDTLTHRQRWSVVGVVAAVAVIAFALGRLNPFFLTCDDFTISGNSAPPGCTVGPATSR